MNSSLKRPRVAAVVTAAILAIARPACTSANVSHPTPLPQTTAQAVDQEELLWWLPADTEAVVVARGPFIFPVPVDEDSGKNRLSRNDIVVEFAQLPLELLYNRFLDLAGPLRGAPVAFAIQGSRHFREPLPGYEVMDFEGCSIVVFDSNIGERVDSLMHRLAKTAASEATITGIRVLVFHHKDGSAEWNSFLALPRPNVLLVANNLPYLQEVLRRMTQREGPRALPSDLPEWRFLDPATRFWGLRHYDRSQAQVDPTSPFGEDRTFTASDPKAVGILFALDPGNSRKATITSFSGDGTIVKDALKAGTSSEEAEIASFNGHEVVTRDGGKTLVDQNPEEGVKYEVKLRSSTPGVLERIYTLNRTGTLGYFILNMEVGLGRGMYF